MFDSEWSADEGDKYGRMTGTATLSQFFRVEGVEEYATNSGRVHCTGRIHKRRSEEKPILNSEYSMGNTSVLCTNGDMFLCKFLRADLGFDVSGRRMRVESGSKAL